jgi:hypothetical protein
MIVERKYSEPWPLCWQLMQWDLLIWINIRKEDTAIKVLWNEAHLHQQIKPLEFREQTRAFRDAIENQLQSSLTWVIDVESPANAHTVSVYTSSK